MPIYTHLRGPLPPPAAATRKHPHAKARTMQHRHPAPARTANREGVDIERRGAGALFGPMPLHVYKYKDPEARLGELNTGKEASKQKKKRAHF